MSSFPKVVLLVLKARLAQRPLRNLLTVLGVALGVAASVAVDTANREVLRSFDRAVMTVAGPTTLEISGGELGVDEMLVAAARKVPGVHSANPVVLHVLMTTGARGREQAVVVLGLDLVAEFESRGFRLRSREAPAPIEDFLKPDHLFIGRALAVEWNVSAGDSVEFTAGARRVRYHVAGVLQDHAGRASFWDRLAVMDIAAAQVAFERVGRLDRIDVVTGDERTVDDIARDLRAALPPHVTVERPSSRTTQVELMVQSFRLNLMVLSWVGSLVGMFLIYNTMAFAVAQRRREIGIYRAIGMTPRRVATLFLAEAGLLGLLGGIVGSLAGIGLAQKLMTLVGRTISDLYMPVGAGDAGLFGISQFREACVEGMLIGGLVSMIGAIGPCLDASRTVTVRALAPGDYEASRRMRAGLLARAGLGLLAAAGGLSLGPPVGGIPMLGYLSTFCLLAGLSCLAPICVTGRRRNTPGERGAGMPGSRKVMWDIAVDHASRNPGRNGVTIAALMVGLAIMIGVIIMVRSFRHTVEIWINETVIADLVVAPATWLRGTEGGSGTRSLPPSWLPVLSSLPDVAAVDTYRDVRLDVNGRRVAVVSRDLRLHAKRSRYLVRRGDSSVHLSRAADIGGVLISEVLADKLGVQEGETLEIETPEGAKRFPVVAVFYDYATDGGKVVMDRALYRSLWHDEMVTVYPVYLTAGAELDRVRQTVSETLGIANKGGLPPFLISNAELRKDILDIFDRTFLLTYVLEAIAVLIAMLGIVNTLVTSILERRREFATLRAIGGSAGQVRQLVLWEAAYLGLIGIGLGLTGGGLLSLLLVKVINKQSFGWTIQMIVPVGALLQAVGLAAAATLLAGYFPARWASQQPVAEGLREE